MRRINIKNILLIFLIAFIFASCSKNKDFTTTELGFSFKHCTNHLSSVKIEVGDVVFGQMKILLNNKQVIYNNYGSPSRLFVIKDAKKGSIDEFLTTLHIGDSAVMIAPADSLTQFTKAEMRPTDKLYVYMTISQIISKKELSGLDKERKQKQDQEEEQLTQWVLNKYSRAIKKESGLFYLSTYEGTGEKVEYGKRIYVAYSVMDTSGKVYDTNIEEVARKSGLYSDRKLYKPFDFILGDDALIAGWTEGLSYMRVGGRSILVIPSHLAYGENGFGAIAPYTPLVFEISVVKQTDE